MPPSYKFTKEEIVQAALAITRQDGFSAVTARSVGEHLGCSSKIVFGSFSGMDELKDKVIAAAYAQYEAFITSAMESGKYPPYKASGMAYIDFARKETELFKLLFLRDRGNATSPVPDRTVEPILKIIMQNTGLSHENAGLLHMELWAFVHGIATMIATSYLQFSDDEISRMLTDSYVGIYYRFTGKDITHGSH